MQLFMEAGRGIGNDCPQISRCRVLLVPVQGDLCLPCPRVRWAVSSFYPAALILFVVSLTIACAVSQMNGTQRSSGRPVEWVQSLIDHPPDDRWVHGPGAKGRSAAPGEGRHIGP